MTRERKQELAETAAYAFRKVAHMNPQGINAAWVTHITKASEGIFLRPRQAKTIAAMAAAINGVHEFAKGKTP